jgi:hypothetical protein
MAAAIEIDETNAGPVIHHGILNSNFGSVDAFELDPVSNPLTLSSNSFEKWQQVHLTALGGSGAVQNIRYWSATARPTGSAFTFNGHETQAIYDTTKKTSWSAPSITGAASIWHVPTSLPIGANFGIGGSLTGQLTSPGTSDYMVPQIRLESTVTQSAIPVINVTISEVA